MSTNSNNRLLTSASVKSIMSKRDLVPSASVGRKVVLTVQGNGNVIDVKDKDGKPVLSSIPGQEGTILQKKIFNVKANSEVAMRNERTRNHFIAGMTAEKQGDAELASEEFNTYLNGTQMSFGILLPSATADALSNGVDIAAKVIKVDTDNGSLLTIDPSTISVKEPDFLDAGTTFSLEDFEIPDVKPLTAKELEKRKAARTA